MVEVLAERIGERSKGDGELGKLVELSGDNRGKERKNDVGSSLKRQAASPVGQLLLEDATTLAVWQRARRRHWRAAGCQ